MQQHVPEYRRQLPEPDLYGLDTAGITGPKIALLSGIE
jgi:hypothetical protein